MQLADALPFGPCLGLPWPTNLLTQLPIAESDRSGWSRSGVVVVVSPHVSAAIRLLAARWHGHTGRLGSHHHRSCVWSSPLRPRTVLAQLTVRCYCALLAWLGRPVHNQTPPSIVVLCRFLDQKKKAPAQSNIQQEREKKIISPSLLETLSLPPSRVPSASWTGPDLARYKSPQLDQTYLAPIRHRRAGLVWSGRGS
jgi:hypothetical protein